MAWSGPRWARSRWLVLLVLLGACNGGYGWSEASLTVDADGGQSVEFALGRCMGESPYRLDVSQTDDEVRIGVEGGWSDHDDCAFGDIVMLDEPLGDREVVLTGPGHRYRACEVGPGAGAETPPGWQLLCRDDETTAETSPIFSRPPFEGLWVVEGAVPPVWMQLDHVGGPGSFRLVGSAGCNEIVVEVVADAGGGWHAPEASITEAPCEAPAADAERESGRWELGSLGAGGELPTSSSCWSLSRWRNGAFVDELVLVDGVAFGAPDRHVAFEDEPTATAAGARCGETIDEPQHVALPPGVARPGAYEVCDGGGVESETCHRFAVVEPGVVAPPIRRIRADLAGVVIAYDGPCRSGVAGQPSAAVIVQDPIDGRCVELTGLTDVTDDVVEVIRAGGPDDPAPGLVLGADGAALADGLVGEHGAFAVLIDGKVIAIISEPPAAGETTIVVDSFFDTDLAELERQRED